MPIQEIRKNSDIQSNPESIEAGLIVEREWNSLLDFWKNNQSLYDLRNPKRLRFFLFYLNLQQQIRFLKEFVNILFSKNNYSPIPLIEAAMKRPELRRLYPFTSHTCLGFSRTTGYPFTNDCPAVESRGNGSYVVYAPGSLNIIGKGGLDEVIAILIEHLPENCGPALNGTKDDHIDSP